MIMLYESLLHNYTLAFLSNAFNLALLVTPRSSLILPLIKSAFDYILQIYDISFDIVKYVLPVNRLFLKNLLGFVTSRPLKVKLSDDIFLRLVRGIFAISKHGSKSYVIQYYIYLKMDK